MTLVLPPDAIIEAIHGSVTTVYSRVDIYESDNVTPWMIDAPVVDGSYAISSTRDERRTANFTFDTDEGDLSPQPGGFWYDKIIKAYRGVVTPTSSWETIMGEFYIDGIDKASFPSTVSVSTRDATKKLLKDKFPASIEFPTNHPIEEIVETIALNGGITKFDLPLTGHSTGKAWLFDRGTERWKAIKDLCTAFNYDVFFSPTGELTMAEYADPANPALSPSEYTFRADAESNLVSFQKKTADERLYNHIVVTGERADQLPVYAEAENNEITSPTRISEIGRRTYFYTSSFIETVPQAQAVADRFLAVHALEQFDVSVEAIVAPYLTTGIIADFLDPEAGPGDPTRFLVTELGMPHGLGVMSGTMKRVTVVG